MPMLQAEVTRETKSLENQLVLFIQWSLRQSRSPQFTANARMKILERAWQAQKKVWAMRNTDMMSLVYHPDCN